MTLGRFNVRPFACLLRTPRHFIPFFSDGFLASPSGVFGPRICVPQPYLTTVEDYDAQTRVKYAIKVCRRPRAYASWATLSSPPSQQDELIRRIAHFRQHNASKRFCVWEGVCDAISSSVIKTLGAIMTSSLVIITKTMDDDYTFFKFVYRACPGRCWDGRGINCVRFGMF